MRAEEIQGLMEAYSKVNATPEVLSEGVVEEDIEVLDEAPMTAFQAAGGQAKLDQLNKGRSPRAGRVTAAQIEKQGQENLFKAGGGNAAIAKGPTRSQNIRGGGTRQVPTLTRQDIINRGTVAAAKPAAAPAKPKVQLLLQHHKNQKDLQWISGELQIQNLQLLQMKRREFVEHHKQTIHS